MSERVDPTVQAVALLMAAYPEMVWEDPTIRLYCRMLQDIDSTLLQVSIENLIATAKSKYPPRISEIRGKAVELHEQAHGVPDQYTAWEQVLEALAEYNPHRAPEQGLSGITLRAVQSLGGLRALYRSETMAADRARFLEAYCIHRERQRAALQAPPSTRAYLESGGSRAEALMEAGNKKRGSLAPIDGGA